MAYTTTEFLDNVKTRASVPTSQSTFTVARILSLADAELRAYIMPLFLRAREYYLAYDYQTNVTSDGLYPVPTRAIGAKLIDAYLIDGESKQNLTWLTEDELMRLDQSVRGIPGIFIKRNTVNLIPPTSHGFSQIRLVYNIRPGSFIATTSAAQITGVNTGTNTLTFASGTIPSTYTTSMTFDMIQAQPHFDALAIDQTASSITTTTMVFSSLPTLLAVGDWVSLANQSPIIQVPVEVQPLLEQKVAATLLRSQGDMESYKAAKEEVDEMKKDTQAVYLPRIEKSGKKILLRSRLLRRL